MCERKVKLTKLLWCVFVLFTVVFLTCTLSVRFLIKSVKSNRTVKVHFQVRVLLFSETEAGVRWGGSLYASRVRVLCARRRI